MEKWKTLNSSYLLKNPHGNIRQDSCLLPNGVVIDHYIVNEYPQWVNIVAVTQKREMVFVRQYRHGIGDFSLEIPGGTVKKGETESDSIVRELREETGYISDDTAIPIGSFLTNPALATNTIKTFLLLNVYEKYKQSMDDTEDIKIVLIPMKDVEHLIKQGEISQIFTVTAYFVAKEYLKNLDFES